MMWYGGMGLWMVLGMVLMLLFWVGVIGLVVWGIAAPARRHGPGTVGTEEGDALGIAKERYARGEISRAQFDQIKSDLY
jgi:putative membrane protein